MIHVRFQTDWIQIRKTRTDIYVDFFAKSSLKSLQDLREQYRWTNRDFFRFCFLIPAYRADQGLKAISEVHKGLKGPQCGKHILHEGKGGKPGKR